MCFLKILLCECKWVYFFQKTFKSVLFKIWINVTIFIKSFHACILSRLSLIHWFNQAIFLIMSWNKLLHRGAFYQFPIWWIYYCHALWLEMRNLNHLPFGMIMSLDIGLMHPSGLLRHEISQKKWKKPKKILKATSKTR